jgi:mRNA-degrading endonuclease RelE of RelBE toxin-antitoxin system
MSYNILPLPPFEKQIKRLVKKYPSLKSEYLSLIESLEKNPNQGSNIGNNCFKIRIAIASKGKGKSGGARVITHVVIEDKTIYLLFIYDKSEQSDIQDKELKMLLSSIER